MIDAVRNTQNAKLITDAKDFNLNNYSTLSKLSLNMATNYQLSVTNT